MHLKGSHIFSEKNNSLGCPPAEVSKEILTNTVSRQNTFDLSNRQRAIADKENQQTFCRSSPSIIPLDADSLPNCRSSSTVASKTNEESLYKLNCHKSTNGGSPDQGNVVLEPDIDKFQSASTAFWTGRRSSILELQTWTSKGAHVKTHVTLRRLKATEKTQENDYHGTSLTNIADIMKAFSETSNLKLSESDECDMVSTSIPNISSRKPNKYFKKLKAFVMSKRSKSLGEIASTNIKQTHSSAPDGVDNEASETALDSSSESLTDKETAESAKKFLSTLGAFKTETRLISKEDKPGNKKLVGSQDSFSSAEDVDDTGSPDTARQRLSEDHTHRNTLNVPPSGTVSQILVRNGSVRKRTRTTSETNYSLLRPDLDDNYQASSTVVFNRLPSIRHRHYHVHLQHYLRVIPDPDNPEGLQVLKDASHVNPMDTGDVIVTDILSNRLIVFDQTGTPSITFAMEPGSEPWATCLTPGGDLAVTLKRQGCVSLWSPSGEPISEFGQEYLASPSGVQCDTKGNFLVADEEEDVVFVFDNKGNMVSQLYQSRINTNSGFSSSSKKQSLFSKPRYICTTNQGKYIVSDSANHSIKIFNASFRLISQFGAYGRQDGQFKFPYGVASDEEEQIYVADYFNNRVSLFSKDGEFIEHLLTTEDQISRPKGLAVKNGLMYVTYGDLRANKVAVFKLRRT